MNIYYLGYDQFYIAIVIAPNSKAARKMASEYMKEFADAKKSDIRKIGTSNDKAQVIAFK